ncbi:ectonucleoside triphosphate diphosphohydrolase 8 [Chanos chanos]|uniref:Ectonucleoside triphosphate diphosphohydrolase 8 n=1 Tax=Chanos chanos TaxID=29144 RepID=A0A6J2VLQ2_CHACN|nr:ectonucleoside triphosphate diphosphohydrolase 8-like [Chanos chanos]
MKKLGKKQIALGGLLVTLTCMSIIALILSLARHYTVDLPYVTQYGIVFDAGSSHTSLYLYKWPGGKQNNTGIVSQQLMCEADGGGIASYVENPPEAGRSLVKCLDVAMAAVPSGQQSTTPLYLGATAGMRLLSLQNPDQSDQILAEVTKTIRGYPFDFRGALILSGTEEGAYGWITINYLLEGLIKYTFEGQWVHPKTGRILGALDMGGASTQISFTPQEPVRDPASAKDLQLYGYKYQVYTHSYLCYGQDQAVKQLQVYLFKTTGSPSIVRHPCYPLGYNLTMTLGELFNSPCVEKPANFDSATSVTFSGASESQSCLDLMENIVNVTDCPYTPDCGFNGAYQPPVYGTFFAFSAYFYTFDFLGLAPQSPLPKVISTIDAFCNRTWESLRAEYPDVREQYLRDYCFAAHYIMTVLLRGYKFNDTWDQIYFYRTVADTDIGWTLGYMLNLTNMIPAERPLVVTGVQHSQFAAEVFFIVFVLFLSLCVIIMLCVWNTEH